MLSASNGGQRYAAGEVRWNLGTVQVLLRVGH